MDFDDAAHFCLLRRRRIPLLLLFNVDVIIEASIMFWFIVADAWTHEEVGGGIVSGLMPCAWSVRCFSRELAVGVCLFVFSFPKKQRSEKRRRGKQTGPSSSQPTYVALALFFAPARMC